MNALHPSAHMAPSLVLCQDFSALKVDMFMSAKLLSILCSGFAESVTLSTCALEEQVWQSRANQRATYSVSHMA